jgi:outer membrane protein assembly factor BamB
VAGGQEARTLPVRLLKGDNYAWIERDHQCLGLVRSAVRGADGADPPKSDNGVHAFDPGTGKPYWQYLFPTRAGVNISTPVWSQADHLLFLSAAYDGGTRVLQLAQTGGRSEAKELWFSNKMRVHFGNVLRIGDYFYGSSGDFGPSFLTAIHARTGQIAWQDRSFAKVNFLLADGKVILLDEDGNLGLATLSAEGLKVLARAAVVKATSWTVPTLLGTTLYVRDRVNIMAFDLGA